MPGSVTEVKVSVGDEVKVNQPLLITEAMKMETTIQAPFNGVIKKLLLEMVMLLQRGFINRN